jgi:hypothetical protein
MARAIPAGADIVNPNVCRLARQGALTKALVRSVPIAVKRMAADKAKNKRMHGWSIHTFARS